MGRGRHEEGVMGIIEGRGGYQGKGVYNSEPKGGGIVLLPKGRYTIRAVGMADCISFWELE